MFLSLFLAFACQQKDEEPCAEGFGLVENGNCYPLAGFEGDLTLEEFEEEFVDLFCSEWEACNTATSCPTSEGTSSGTQDCDFDPDAARECLDGEWLCNEEFPGFEFPVAPAACSSVCG
jgi:hypothetical protein